VCGLMPVLGAGKFSIGCFDLIYSSKRITMFIIKNLKVCYFLLKALITCRKHYIKDKAVIRLIRKYACQFGY